MLCRCALVFVLTATVITAAATLSTDDKQTIVRITQPVEAGEYLTGLGNLSQPVSPVGIGRRLPGDVH